ncbi:MAG: DUF1838 family protein [Rhodospirillaceae bacterium]|nr:DUF1838 family protein [Rhodospirillaceae bacterium]
MLKLDPNNPEHVHLIHRKLAYCMPGAPAFMWLKATRYGVVDSRVIPFWDMHVGQAFATRDLDDGAYEVTIWTAIFYTDVSTGKFMERFANPLTNKVVDVRYNAPRVGKRTYTQHGEEREPINRPEMNIMRATGVGPAWIENGLIWVRGDTSTRMEPKDPGKAKLSQVNDWSTYTGRLSDVADPKNLNPRANWIFNDINTWPAWLEMGDQPGNYVSRGIGQKERDFDAMPEVWRKMLAEQYPGYAKDPVAPLKG